MTKPILDRVLTEPGFLRSTMAVPTKSARQLAKHIKLMGINAVQLAWWFQHLADKDGIYWKALSPKNETITWMVSMYDAAGHIGTLWESDQVIPDDLFPDNRLHMQVQYMDWHTQGRDAKPGQATPLNLAMGPPTDYDPPFPSPVNAGDVNGYNENMLLFDGHGFCPGRILCSWINTGNNDTADTQGAPFQLEFHCTFYLHWMEGTNLPPTMSTAGYYFSEDQIDALWLAWEEMLTNLPNYLPKWWSEYSQDGLARSKGWTLTHLADTPVFQGVSSDMMVWWWNHGMGDAPGNAYTFWAPPAHHAIRWLPGYSPMEILETNELPTDRVIPGAISADLQGPNLVQDGGGMMWYPSEMSPIPGIYKTILPMSYVTAAQIADFKKERWPLPPVWLLHQWEDVPGGLIHRSTIIQRLPLPSPVPQENYLTEHQYLEGQFMANSFLVRLYHHWLKKEKA